METPWPVFTQPAELRGAERSRNSTRAYLKTSGGERLCLGPRAHRSRSSATTMYARENVVYLDEQAVALLDFGFAVPGRRVYHLAQMAKMCCPLDAPEAAARLGMGDVDVFSRFRALADGYGLPPGRQALVDAVEVAVDVGDRFVERHVDAGEAGFVSMWTAGGGRQRMERRRQWLGAHRQRLIEAVG